MPGQKGNLNRFKHGCSHLRIAGSKLPKGCMRAERIRNVLRSLLEAAVLARRDEIDVYHACLIQTAIRWETHSRLAARWLRLQYDQLSPADRLAYSREVASASTNRDRCLRALGIDRQAAGNLLDRLYSTAEPVLTPPAGNGDCQDHSDTTAPSGQGGPT